MNIIEYLFKTRSFWRSLSYQFLKAIINSNLYIITLIRRWNKFNISCKIHKQILAKYFKNNVSGKLKYLSADLSFIKNEYALKSEVGFNNQYKKKRLSKLSLIVDSKGVPVSSILKAGNISGQSLFNSNYKDILINITYNN